MQSQSIRVFVLLALVGCGSSYASVCTESNAEPIAYFINSPSLEGTSGGDVCQQMSDYATDNYGLGEFYVRWYTENPPFRDCRVQQVSGSVYYDKTVGYASSASECGCATGTTQVETSGGIIWCAVAEPDPQQDLSNCNDSWDAHTGNCGTFPEDCAAAGGSFGWFGPGNELEPVCLPSTEGDPAPECGVDLVCNTPIPEDGSSSGDLDPDDPGAAPGTGVDDTQANNNYVPGTDSGGNACDASQGGDCVANDTNGNGVCDAGEPNCIQRDEQSRGECDPQSANYAECIGQVEDATGLDDFIDNANSEGRDFAIANIGNALTDSLNAENPVDTDTTGLTDIVDGMLPTGGSCADFGFTWKGHDLTISCAKMQLFRDVLSWVFYIWGVLSIAEIIFRKPM